ncbi:uncharacterized protein LOC124341692 [Daphnia pulicaria]|uniref:uncharacterized protein LOC124341692 n=1 Tax=Daphnia pulicaria TaxID=35523 RepID=UPI001EEB61C9|nr:uncharacterized protein LOC124341692 [Daphnia pulicaria]
MTSCGHGVIQCSIDMHEGETFRHTFASHVKVHSLKNQKQHKNLNITETEKNTEDESANTVFFGPKFFVNDVVCQYWPFAIKMGELSEAYSYLTSDMVPFLSRLHGQAHSWPCQILHFGHWRDGSAGTLGEEQEQVFSTFSSYSNSTKTMGAANRRDFLTGAMFYWNGRKEKGMARTLTRRMLIAIYRVQFYHERLNKLLSAKKMKLSELPVIQASLEEEARVAREKEKIVKLKWDYLSELKSELERIHFQHVTLHDRISSVAVSCKWRTKLRRKQTLLKAKAVTVMNDINDLANVMVTEQNFLDGVFPWDSNQNVSFKDNFKLVDCWMLYKRNTEQILQCKLEMSQFITTISEDILSMQHEIRNYNSTDEFSFSVSNCPMNISVFQQSEIVIKMQEVKRLEMLLSDSLALKQYFYEENLDDDDLVFEDDCMDDYIADGDGIDKDDLCDEIECSSDDEF